MKQYINPIIKGHNPDPSICRVGNDYYLVTSSNEYFPGVPVYHSRDLVNWELLGHCLDRPSQIPLDGSRCSGGIYAPTIRYNDGVFYMTTTNVNGLGNFYVTATNPAGPWSEPIKVAMTGIDPSITFDDDGTVYYQTNQPDANGVRGTTTAVIDIRTGAVLTEPRPTWYGTGGRFPEAPHMYKINGWYYQILAEGGTQFAHMVTIARSKSPWGPFEACPHNPVLSNVRSMLFDIHCVGHADLFEDASGNWWMVCLGIRLARKYMTNIGRETFLVPVEWREDGWPYVNYGKFIEPVSYGPLPETDAVAGESSFKLWGDGFTDDFRGDKLAHCWRRLRNPDESDYRLLNPGLEIRGNKYDLCDVASPTFVCIRQYDFDFVASAEISFEPSGENEEAGLAVLLSNMFYSRLAITKVDGKRKLRFERRADDMTCVDYFDIPDSTGGNNDGVILSINADRERYSFSYECNGIRGEAGTVSTRFLSCETVGGCFTGTQIGVYSTGKGAACAKPAVVRRFSYRA